MMFLWIVDSWCGPKLHPPALEQLEARGFVGSQVGIIGGSLELTELNMHMQRVKEPLFICEPSVAVVAIQSADALPVVDAERQGSSCEVFRPGAVERATCLESARLAQY